MDPAAVKTQLLEAAQGVGFAAVRIAPALPATHRQVYETWVAEGKHGDMAWMARNIDRRSDPRLLVPGAQAVVVLAINYFQGEPQPAAGFRIARYAWNDDYHDLIGPKLKQLDDFLTSQGGQQRHYVDTGPVLERDFASESGLGWGGKSTMQIHRELGTWFFLATIITTLPLPPDLPARDHCGSCTRCITACPTLAITGPRSMDARRCISYLTIEHKGSIPVEFRAAIGDRLYGCDDCLTACPWNRFAQASSEATFAAREAVFNNSLRDFLKLSDDEFRLLFAKSPIKRIKRPAFLRNVCVVLGNVGTAADLSALQAACADPHPLIQEHAHWAIEQIQSRSNP